jgi:hypothetical protein
MTQADRTPPVFEAGQRLTAVALNSLAQSVARIIDRMQGTQVIQPLDLSGKLAGNLAKATSFSTTPGTATVNIWGKDTNGNMIDTGRTETVVNRMEHIEGFTGDIVYCRWMDGEWRLVSLDCGG